jgi:hypothetical protein
MSAGVSDWDHLLSEMMRYLFQCSKRGVDTEKQFRCTVPGGYVELLENTLNFQCDDGTMKPDHGGVVFLEHLREALEKMGRPHPTHEFLKNQLEKAGFEDVQMLSVKEPFGPWPKDPRMKKIGAMSLLNGETGFESYGMAAFTRVLEMDVEKARGLCEHGLRDVRNKNYHVYGLQ